MKMIGSFTSISCSLKIYDDTELQLLTYSHYYCMKTDCIKKLLHKSLLVQRAEEQTLILSVFLEFLLNALRCLRLSLAMDEFTENRV